MKLANILIVLTFLVTHGIAYWVGKTESDTLALNAMEKFASFYSEVESNIYDACEFDGSLKGLYKDRFAQLTNIIEGRLTAPYENPCRLAAQEFKKPAPPEFGRLFLQTECDKWDSWSQFMSSDDVAYEFCIGEQSYPIELPKEARRKIFNLYKEAGGILPSGGFQVGVQPEL